MTRKLLLIACLLGATAVALGAFGAHVFKKLLSEGHYQAFQTGVQYQFYHTFALIAAAFLYRYTKTHWARTAGWLFLAGVICFSGSLYILSVGYLIGLDSFASLLGPVTPIGGLLFIAGWATLFMAAINYRGSRGKG